MIEREQFERVLGEILSELRLEQVLEILEACEQRLRPLDPWIHRHMEHLVGELRAELFHRRSLRQRLLGESVGPRPAAGGP